MPNKSLIYSIGSQQHIKPTRWYVFFKIKSYDSILKNFGAQTLFNQMVKSQAQAVKTAKISKMMTQKICQTHNLHLELRDLV